jgi:DNA-binding transcriptional MerR regulator
MIKNDKLFNISEASKILGLTINKNGKPSNHILRFWEKQFKQIKPTILNNRRYYGRKDLEVLKLIKFLLKNQNLTTKGVKKILNDKINTLDDYKSSSIKTLYYKNLIKTKTNLILSKLKKIKNKNGKKNTH